MIMHGFVSMNQKMLDKFTKSNFHVFSIFLAKSNPNKSKKQISTDCYLRQGASGTEFAHFGSRTCFLMWFYKRSQTYFGQKSEEHVKTIKKRRMDSKNNDF